MVNQVITTPTGGYILGQEDDDWLRANRLPLMRSSLSELPEFVDFGEWTRIENQGGQGACQGFALSTGVELCHVEQGGGYTQLSAGGAYYESQRLSGIRGDTGSTITGGCKLAKEHGLVTEADWPYPDRYDPRRPAGFDQMVRYKISGYDEVGDFDDLVSILLSRKPVHIGISWGSSMDRHTSGGLVTNFRAGGGGHSVELMGAHVVDFAGNSLRYPHPCLYNSWSQRWGNKGRCLITREAYDQMRQHRWSVFMVLHGAPSPEPSQIKYV